VEIADVIYALRNIAIKGGKIPGIYQQFLSAISNDGRIVKVSKFAENKRVTIGLPPLTSTNVDAIKKILSATGLDKLTREGEATQ
jgi:heterodisulfide reductase subunit C